MNPELTRLIEGRQKAWHAMRTTSDAIADEGREWTAEENSSWLAANADLDALDARIEHVVKLETRDDNIEAMLGKYGKPSDPHAEHAESDEDILRAIGRGERRNAEFAPEARVLSKLTAGAGANTVPVGFYDRIIEAMRDTSTVMAAGATVLNTTSGEGIQVPTVAASAYPSASLIAETDAISVSDVAFGQTTLAAYKYAFLTQLSSELLADTAVNIVEFLGRRGGEALGTGIGAAFITGTGSSQPTGINGSAGFTSVASLTGSAAAGFTYNDVLTLQHSITRPYRANASFIGNDSVSLTLRRLRADGATGQYLWQPSLQAGVPDTLAGAPFFADPAMPTATTNAVKGLAFGDWSKGVMIRIAGGVRVESSDDFAFSTDLQTWRFITRADARIVDAGAARVMTYTT